MAKKIPCMQVIIHGFKKLHAQLQKQIKQKTLEKSRVFEAADGNRTRDLRTTNATLYRLSHSSGFLEVCLPQSPKVNIP